MLNKPGNIILFDGICNLCNGSVAFVSKRDKKRRFTFISLQSSEGQELLSQFNFSQTDFDTVIYIADDAVCTKSTAGLKILKYLGWPWKILYPLIIIPVPIRDFVYDIIAKYRYKIFGRKHNCQLPPS